MQNENVRRAVADSGLKQKFIAEKLGISEPTMTAILNGSRKITVNEFFALADVLGMDVEQLFNYPSAS